MSKNIKDGLIGGAGFKSDIYSLAQRFLIDNGQSKILIATLENKYYYYTMYKLLEKMNFKFYGGEMNDENKTLVINLLDHSFKFQDDSLQDKSTFDIPYDLSILIDNLSDNILKAPITRHNPIRIQSDVGVMEEFIHDKIQRVGDFVDNLNIYIKRNLYKMRDLYPFKNHSQVVDDLKEYVEGALMDRYITTYISDQNFEIQIKSGNYNRLSELLISCDVDRSIIKEFHREGATENILKALGFSFIVDNDLLAENDNGGIRIKYEKENSELNRIDIPVVTPNFHIRNFKGISIIILDIPNDQENIQSFILNGDMNISDTNNNSNIINTTNFCFINEDELLSLVANDSRLILVEGDVQLHATIDDVNVDFSNDISDKNVTLKIDGEFSEIMTFQDIRDKYIKDGKYYLVEEYETTPENIEKVIEYVNNTFNIKLPDIVSTIKNEYSSLPELDGGSKAGKRMLEIIREFLMDNLHIDKNNDIKDICKVIEEQVVNYKKDGDED